VCLRLVAWQERPVPVRHPESLLCFCVIRSRYPNYLMSQTTTSSKW
jgi:hypothetical protein